jgi:putative thioredoxin
MGYSLEINSLNYQEEVVDKSATKPVIVDFFATWCGPCQLIKPILEKLAPEYDFILAKIDIDLSPDLAEQFSIEGVPDVRIVRDGEMSAGFVGALSETQIRELLVQFNLQSALESEIEALKKAKIVRDFPQGKQILDRLFTTYSDRPEIALEAAKFLITLGRLEMAEKMLATVNPEETIFYRQAQAIAAIINWQNELKEIENTDDSELDSTYFQALQSTLKEDYTAALNSFLEIVNTSRKYRDDRGKKAMLTIFTLLGDRDPLTLDYQQRLMRILY